MSTQLARRFSHSHQYLDTLALPPLHAAGELRDQDLSECRSTHLHLSPNAA